MSSLRRHFRIVLDGRTVDLVSSARDIASAEEEGLNGETKPMLYAFAICHAAAIRLGVDGVPHDRDKFIDLMDDFEDLEPDARDATANPTRATV
jgi:hypothetical protein